jgi:hypothetical protein
LTVERVGLRGDTGDSSKPCLCLFFFNFEKIPTGLEGRWIGDSFPKPGEERDLSGISEDKQ